jgi:LmbE family N-acetylglucosaminyl deacetylase
MEMSPVRDASAELCGSAKVVRRPHFRQVGDELLFLISRRPHARLSDAERAVWTALEGEPSVDALRIRFPGANAILRRFVEWGICEIVETEFRPGRRRILIFEPHSDDAVLSVGGTMWLRRHEVEFTVATIGSRSNFTSYYYLERDYFNVREISSLRDAEGTLFCRLLGGRYQALGQPEAALRYHDGDWSLDWHRQHKHAVSAFIAHHSGSRELRAWMDAIRATLLRERPDEVWFPLGGPHTDHQLTRDACLTLMSEEPKLLEGCETRFYQDVPYAAWSPEFTSTVLRALTASGAELIPEIVSIATGFEEKLHLVSLYGSQFKIDVIGPDVRECARMAAEGAGLAERFWLLRKPPATTQPVSIRFDEPIVRRAADLLSPWVRRHRNAERIRLLLLVPAGRWAEDMQYLLRVFPRAHFDIYAAVLAETEQFQSPRIRVSHVGSGLKAWGRFAFRLMLMKPLPTLFLAGQKRLREAQMLSRLWPMSDPIVIPTMDHLVAALQGHASGED